MLLNVPSQSNPPLTRYCLFICIDGMKVMEKTMLYSRRRKKLCDNK